MSVTQTCAFQRWQPCGGVCSALQGQPLNSVGHVLQTEDWATGCILVYTVVQTQMSSRTRRRRQGLRLEWRLDVRESVYYRDFQGCLLGEAMIDS